MNGLLEMAHEHEVSCLEPAIVEGVVVDVTEHCPRPDPPKVQPRIVVDELGELCHHCGGVFLPCVSWRGTIDITAHCATVNLGEELACRL